LNQRELSQAADPDEGYTSRIVLRLEETGLIVQDENGLRNPKARTRSSMHNTKPMISRGITSSKGTWLPAQGREFAAQYRKEQAELAGFVRELLREWN